ncbi:MAG: lipopolysaccharide assembly protein LapB [Pseudomonadota bacterium]|nr:lipopolysaccharide assembly protein LapB [Pseudomonadota bacterium]
MIDLEYWWLLIFPLFFGLGWIAARIDIGQILSENRRLPQSYFKGLNFLVNEQPDKAIEAFVEIADVSQETFELHFALGKLFRRTGEVERAIRMHKSLVDRTHLSSDQKLAALYELGQDYYRAGLLDRTEEIFIKLIDSPYALDAMRHLLDIFVREREWAKANEMTIRLEKEGLDYRRERAHFICEQAQAAAARQDIQNALERLAEAIFVNPACVRANVIKGQLEAAAGRHDAAVEAWLKIEHQNPVYLSLVAKPMLESLLAAGLTEDAAALFTGFLEKYHSLDLLDCAYHAVLSNSGARPAYDMLRDYIRVHPSLHGLDKLLEVQLLDMTPLRRGDTALIKSLVHRHTARLSVFRCENCGFCAHIFHWQCPACMHWDTILPRRIEEITDNQMEMIDETGPM